MPEPQNVDDLDRDELLSELPQYVREAVVSMEEQGADWDTIGEQLANAPANALAAQKGGPDWNTDLWSEVKSEFAVFLCQDEERYSDLQSEGKALGDMNEKLLISGLSGGMGSYIGAASGILAPLVTWLLICAATIGKNALCNDLLD
jgi:hypothetical protein